MQANAHIQNISNINVQSKEDREGKEQDETHRKHAAYTFRPSGLPVSHPHLGKGHLVLQGHKGNYVVSHSYARRSPRATFPNVILEDTVPEDTAPGLSLNICQVSVSIATMRNTLVRTEGEAP